MNLVVNGDEMTVADGATVAEIVELVAPDRTRGIAVAVNGAVVARSTWSSEALADGDRVEVLTAIGGG